MSWYKILVHIQLESGKQFYLQVSLREAEMETSDPILSFLSRVEAIKWDGSLQRTIKIIPRLLSDLEL